MKFIFLNKKNKSSILFKELKISHQLDFKSCADEFFKIKNLLKSKKIKHIIGNTKKNSNANEVVIDFSNTIDLDKLHNTILSSSEVYQTTVDKCIIFNKNLKQQAAEELFLFKTKERQFNNISIYKDKFVKKESTNLKKIKREIIFYKNIPKKIKRYFPKLFSFSINSYTITLTAGFDLAVIFLNDKITITKYKKFLDQLSAYFFKIPRKEFTQSLANKMLHELAVKKLKARWRSYQKTQIYQQVKLQYLTRDKINIDSIVIELSKKLKAKILNLNTKNEVVFLHGDLVFSNIIVLKDRLVFVDPKGADSKEKLFSPLYYDLAKLSQCVCGEYDFILNNSHLKMSPKYKKYFINWVSSLGYDIGLVRLLEASLFLSLLPLHMDNIDKHIKFINSALEAIKAYEE
jgi:hypothetical protein